MIPAIDPETGNLPPGIHEATWDEFVARYGYNSCRLVLLAGLKDALDALRFAGCRRVYIDGSFVSAKEKPGDYDGCWEVASVGEDRLDPVLLELDPPRSAQKKKYRGELFPVNSKGSALERAMLEFFQRDKYTGEPKGIVAIDLGALP